MDFWPRYISSSSNRSFTCPFASSSWQHSLRIQQVYLAECFSRSDLLLSSFSKSSKDTAQVSSPRLLGLVTITLILDQLGPRYSEIEKTQDKQWKARDRSLIKEVISALETVSYSGREPLIRQSTEVLMNLLMVNIKSRSLGLTIPYLGIISVIRINRPTPNPQHDPYSTYKSNTEMHLIKA